jgi:ABC-type Zn uptake system ZnuABC Zn-binding protein ZnuA
VSVALLRSNLAAGLVLALALGTAACSSVGGAGSPGTSVSGRIAVVTTTTVFADLVRNVGGGLVEVTSLVPRDGDVHTFSPRPSDIRAVAGAQLLVMNGLGLDDWLSRTMKNAARPGTPLIALADDLPGVTLLPGDTRGSQNPHLWLDVAYAERYVDRIADGLAAVDPAAAPTIRAQAAAYRGRLVSLDAWARAQLEAIPATQRRIVTYHDAFPYFARAYGLTIVGVSIAAPGQEASAGYTARLVDAVRSQHVRAIFSERQFPAKLVTQLGAETGTRVVTDLYDDALGDAPIDSYVGLVRWDVQRITEALR